MMELRFGMSPISWTNDDLPQLGGDTSLETCLRETRQAGYTGTELGGKFPKDRKSLAKVLGDHDLKLVSGWYSGLLLNNDLKTRSSVSNPSSNCTHRWPPRCWSTAKPIKPYKTAS